MSRTIGKRNPVQEVSSHKKPKVNSPKTPPEDALEVLRHEPGYDLLVSTLRQLAREQPDSASFSIHRPSPLSAQIVQVLVSEIVPNYWTLLKEDSNDGGNASSSSALGLLLTCLRSITSINAILVRLRALIQEAKAETGNKTKRPDISMNTAILLDLLCNVLQGDVCVSEIWRKASAGQDVDSPKLRPLSQELLSIFGSGRIISLAAEADEISKTGSNKTTAAADGIWPADALRYTQWLGQNIVKWQLSDPTAEQTKLCSDLFAKALRLGRSDIVTKQVMSNLLLAKGADDQRFGALLDKLPQMEQRRVLFSVLKIFPEDHLNRLGLCESDQSRGLISAVAGALKSIIGSDENRKNHLVEWLTGSSGAGLGEGVAIRRAVLAVVSEERDRIVTVLEKSIGQFGDQLYIKHSPMLQQEAHAQVLLLSAGYVFRKYPIKLTLQMRSGTWLNTISNRLASTNQRSRFLGMVVGEGLSGLVEKGDKKLDFHMEDTNQAEGKWYKGLVQVSDTVGSWNSLSVPQKEPSKSQKVPQKPPPRPKAQPTRTVQPRQQGFIIEEVDEDTDEDDGLVPYPKPEGDEEDSDDDPTLVRRDKPKAPVYIRDLIRYFRDTESYDRQKLALTTAPTLIRRKANYGTEVAEHADELASLLVGLQDKYEMDNFDDLKLQGMIAIVVAQPQIMGQWFSKTFFDGDYSVSQRASVLVVLGLSARELAGFETSEYAAAAAFPSKTLPERIGRLFIGAAPPNIQQSSASSLKPLPPNALDSMAKSLTSEFLAPLAATAADAATGPDIFKLSTFTDQLNDQQLTPAGNPKVKIKSRARPRVRAIPNTTAQLIATHFFSPLTARFQAALHSSASRVRGIIFHPYLLALYLKTLALMLHAAGPSTLALPQMTAELWRLLLGTSIRAHAVGDLGVTQAVLFGLLAILDVNEDRMRDVCQELGREAVETQEWVASVFGGLRGGDGGEEEEQVKMLAAGVLVRLNEGIEKYQLLMVGDLIG
ncbi:telomere length regulation protein-domain-containing protein [Bombardia bombarda]|uniref:Telomere length regulation protein-domain-containing protein n=1 Tax=Bombardia bombarda TaxID=252184 RepID=A0AA39WZW5_9PEZI|nr:telomere length regulation protein-domain-containing protein [Bombardia bombarda]